MGAKRILLVAAIAAMLPMSGCWNVRELSEMAIVTAMGVDPAPDGNGYRVSLQIVNPSIVATGQVGGGAAKGTPVSVYADTGNTLFEAIRKLSEKSPRELFFSHIRIIIVGEKMARQGIGPLFDFLSRSHETRMTTRLLIAKEERAENVIRVITPIEKIPANAMDGKMRNSKKLWSKVVEVKIDEAMRGLSGKGIEPVLSGILLSGNTRSGSEASNIQESEPKSIIAIRGIGLFKDGKLKRWLDERESRGAVWLLNRMRSTVINLECDGKPDSVSIELTHSSTEVRTEIREGKPKLQIRIKEEGNLTEADCAVDVSDDKITQRMESELAAITRKEVMAALTAAQQEKSDVFGFGETLSRKNAKAWNQMQGNWNDLFAESEADIRVTAFIRRTGMRLKPFLMPDEQ